MVVLNNYLRCVQCTQYVDGSTKELSKVCATLDGSTEELSKMCATLDGSTKELYKVCATYTACRWWY